MKSIGAGCVGVLLLASAAAWTSGKSEPERVAGASARVDFNRQVRPILAEKCYACHGPDEQARKAGLRFDQRADALAPRDGAAAIVPGDPGASAMIARIVAADPDERMPPAESEKTLTAQEIDVLRRWVAQGAEYAAHWAFVPPARPSPPAVSDPAWPRGEIDRFVLARLDAERLAPSPEADRRTLARRLSLDLTGLPPAPEEVEAFVRDEAPDAYERLVERLLASPRFGERMAMEWLDAARYGDTNGYHIDNERYMWRWRDWVIDAYNRDLPFDQFTVEQLAGDLVPGATDAQRLATGFNRNHMINFEGGAIPEEYLNEYVVDRVNTTSTVWLGLTMNCARCHDHKFDPLSARDFYRFYAFFNAVPEQGLDGKERGNAEPMMLAPLPEQAAQLAALEARDAEARAALTVPNPQLDGRQAEWETQTAASLERQWIPLEIVSSTAKNGTTLTLQPDGSVLASGENPATEVYEFVGSVAAPAIYALRLEALPDESFPHNGPGRWPDNGNFVLTDVRLAVAGAGTPPEEAAEVRLASALSDHDQPNFPARNAIDADAKSGWAVLRDGVRNPRPVAVFVPAEAVALAEDARLRVGLHFESQYGQHAIGRVRLSALVDADEYPRVRSTTASAWRVSDPFPHADRNTVHTEPFAPEALLDDRAALRALAETWPERPELADGAPRALEAPDPSAIYLYRTIDVASDRALRLALGSDDGIRIWLDGRLVHDNAAARPVAADQDFVTLDVSAGAHDLLVKISDFGGGCGIYFDLRQDSGIEPPLAVAAALLTPAAQRDASQSARLRDHYRERHWPEWAERKEAARVASEALAALKKQIPTTMVMADAAAPRETRVLLRGEYDKPTGDVLTPGIPAVFGALPAGAAPSRLGLAEWIVRRENPLTARVAVNRLWQMVFGIGLVRTSDDFGTQGEWPSHPELLDWLAVEFVDSGWSTKHMLRLLVTSAAYRQSSRVTPELLERDPLNRLLARGPRFRMSAEMIRDAALAASGLLVERLGGPSVKPYQPPGLWEEVSINPSGNEFTAQVFKQDSGDALYRRSMYTFRKRTVPPPSLAIFDAPNREICIVRRARTNTPLQALVLMNDPTYVEAARTLAQRVLHESGATSEERIDRAFALVLARPPVEEERRILIDLFESQRSVFASEPEDAAALLSVGDSLRDGALDAADFAALTAVASVILNLDEAITKG